MFEKGKKYFFSFGETGVEATCEGYDEENGLVLIKTTGSGDEYIVSLHSAFNYAKARKQ